jgi:hypothetical protein
MYRLRITFDRGRRKGWQRPEAARAESRRCWRYLKDPFSKRTVEVVKKLSTLFSSPTQYNESAHDFVDPRVVQRAGHWLQFLAEGSGGLR